MATFDGKKMKKNISRYLMILGIIQLVGLNIGGIFWIAWAKGINEAKQSSRRWVIIIHSIYLVLCALTIIRWFKDPSNFTGLKIWNHSVELTPFWVLVFLLSLIMIYGLPVIWLMNENMKNQSSKQCEDLTR